MEIIRENTGELTATLHLTISPDDYQPKIDAALKKLQRDSVFPGFRKGKTPMGHIKRLYGKAIIVDEVDKVISENLEKYISENNLDLLGYPLSNPNNQPIDFDNPGTHEFLFDIALTPAFELHPEIIEHIDYQVIIPDDETIDKQIQQYKTTHSTESEDEISGPESILWLEFAEVDDNGHEFEGGLKQNGFISLKHDLLPAGIAHQFEGKSKNDTLILNSLEFAGS